MARVKSLPTWVIFGLGLTLGTLAWAVPAMLGLPLPLAIVIGPGLLRFGAEWWTSRRQPYST